MVSKPGLELKPGPGLWQALNSGLAPDFKSPSPPKPGPSQGFEPEPGPIHHYWRVEQLPQQSAQGNPMEKILFRDTNTAEYMILLQGATVGKRIKGLVRPWARGWARNVRAEPDLPGWLWDRKESVPSPYWSHQANVSLTKGQVLFLCHHIRKIWKNLSRLRWLIS